MGYNLGEQNTKCCINSCPEGVAQKSYPDCSCYCDNECDSPLEIAEPGKDCSCVCKKVDADCPSNLPSLNSALCECECNVSPGDCSGSSPHFDSSRCECTCNPPTCGDDETFDSSICSCVYDDVTSSSYIIP
jgi:hypothetical protein